MKKIPATLLIVIFFVLVSSSVFPDEPPNPGGGPGSGDLPVGGGAPMDGGILWIMVAAAVYSLKRLHDIRRNFFR